MLHVEMPVEGFKRNLRVLIDCGASKNFARRQTLEENASFYAEVDSGTSLTETVGVKLGDGSVVTAPKRSVRLLTQVGTFCSLEDYFLIDLDERWDLILCMGWLEKHQPCINWRAKTIHEVGPDFLKSHMGMESNEPIPSPAGDEQLATLRQLPATGKSTRQGGPMSSKEDIGRQAFNNTWVNTRRTGLPVYKSIAQRTGLQVSFASAPTDRVHGDVIVEEDATERNPIQQLPVSGRVFVEDVISSHCDLTELPKTAEEICKLEEMSFAEFRSALRSQRITSIAVIQSVDEVDLYTTSAEDPEVAGETPPAHFRVWERLRASPFYPLVKEYEDIFPEEVPAKLPKDKGMRHEIDLTPDTKWCVTRQWPLPREQVEFIDSFFAARKKAGHIRESTSPHSSPTFCVKKPSGSWRIVHAYNKLNAATIPAQTPIPRKDVIIDSMGGSTIFSTIDLRDGFYQILVRACDIPKTAVSTPSGMLWEWLVMPQGLANAPVTFNRMVTQKLRPLRDFAPSYLDDIYVHSRADASHTDVEVHFGHLRQVFQTLRDAGLYANLQKCMFGVDEIPVLGEYVGIKGSRPDPAKVTTITTWPVLATVAELRSWLGLATYLHKFSRNFADIATPLTRLLMKDVQWDWTQECQEAFDGIKASLTQAPILALPDFNRPFSVVCDASVRAIGCCLMQKDDEGRDRPVSYQSRQLRAAERNYPVHDLELLAMKYALVKFRIYLLGSKPFTVYTDHASLRTAVN
ncbi:hypothetical protein Ae201684P_019662 [Aphanomyces euteiches]|uniref:Reverse transcriptase domain-containing protein n=1 Tax=Aphanomyces euteiches TaxID=100861 RepID=A0A6G0W5E9_9STRA|nr:hypothetical protein Ae201684_018993 [Aphanomyces euteiches]KAH9078581.1 hypothetical protein Ae201684P_019662 [Aphanomyces euteiches]